MKKIVKDVSMQSSNYHVFIERYKRFFEKERGLFLLNAIRLCDMPSRIEHKEFRPLFAAYYDVHVPDEEEEMLYHFSRLDEISQKHSSIHAFADMLFYMIDTLHENIRCNDMDFLGVRKLKNEIISMPDLIYLTLGCDKSLREVANDLGIEENKILSYRKRKRLALDKIYERLVYNSKIGLVLDYNGLPFDFCSRECISIMDKLSSYYAVAQDKVSRTNAKNMLDNFFRGTIPVALQEVCREFCDVVSSSNEPEVSNFKHYFGLSKDATYIREIPFTITKNVPLADGDFCDLIKADVQKYTSSYILKLGSRKLKSKIPSFAVKPAFITDKITPTLLGISTDNDIFLVVESTLNLKDYNNSCLLSLVGRKSSSDLMSITRYSVRLKAAIDALNQINSVKYKELVEMAGSSKQLHKETLADLYFLTKFL